MNRNADDGMILKHDAYLDSPDCLPVLSLLAPQLVLSLSPDLDSTCDSTDSCLLACLSAVMTVRPVDDSRINGVDRS